MVLLVVETATPTNKIQRDDPYSLFLQGETAISVNLLKLVNITVSAANDSKLTTTDTTTHIY